MDLTKDEVQELIDLTPKQQRAFNAFIKAVKHCNKENVYFYQVLDSVGGLNGNNVDDITIPADYMEDDRQKPATCLQWLSYPNIRVTDGFADDNHYVKLKD